MGIAIDMALRMETATRLGDNRTITSLHKVTITQSVK